jgi:hypothetical protein
MFAIVCNTEFVSMGWKGVVWIHLAQDNDSGGLL